MSERTLLVITGLLPIAAVHLCYVVAASEGHVPWCIPYVDSCTSISATGRHGSAFWLFKLTMLPYALCLMVWWWQGHHLLIRNDAREPAILITGLIGATFLVVYVLALGAVGDTFQLTRRVGIVVYFTFTYLALLLFAHRWLTVSSVSRWRHVPVLLLSLILGIGLLTVVLGFLYEDYDDIEDAFEWVVALLIHLTLVTQALLLPKQQNRQM